MENLTVGVEGMTCQGCEKNLTNVLQALPGVSSVAVSLEKAQADITYDPQQAQPPQFKAAIEGAGFDVICPSKKDCTCKP